MRNWKVWPGRMDFLSASLWEVGGFSLFSRCGELSIVSSCVWLAQSVGPWTAPDWELVER